MRIRIHSDKVRLAIDGRLRIVRVPDDEVDLQVAKKRKKELVYKYSSGIPFGNLRVGEYYRYQTALAGSDALDIKKAFGMVGFVVRQNRRMKSLKVAEYRQVQTAVRLRNDVGGVIVDKASKRMVKAMRKNGCNVFVSEEFGVKKKKVGKKGLDKILGRKGLEFVQVPKKI